MRANPDKTQVILLHLKNREAKRTLKVKWNNSDMDNTPHPKYLGVTLDSTLSYKQHIHQTKMKVATENNLLKKLLNSKWGCNASTIRTTALEQSYSAAEYACPVWAKSPHASKLDPELNNTYIDHQMSEAKQCQRTIPSCGACTNRHQKISMC